MLTITIRKALQCKFISPHALMLTFLQIDFCLPNNFPNLLLRDMTALHSTSGMLGKIKFRCVGTKHPNKTVYLISIIVG
jgi:hypothetical protein